MSNIPFVHLLTSTGGSWFIYLLFALSILALAVIMERAIIINRQYFYQVKILPSLTIKLEERAPKDLLATLRPDSILYRIAKELLEHTSKGIQSLERHLETRMAL